MGGSNDEEEGEEEENARERINDGEEGRRRNSKDPSAVSFGAMIDADGEPLNVSSGSGSSSSSEPFIVNVEEEEDENNFIDPSDLIAPKKNNNNNNNNRNVRGTPSVHPPHVQQRANGGRKVVSYEESEDEDADESGDFERRRGETSGRIASKNAKGSSRSGSSSKGESSASKKKGSSKVRGLISWEEYISGGKRNCYKACETCRDKGKVKFMCPNSMHRKHCASEHGLVVPLSAAAQRKAADKKERENNAGSSDGSTVPKKKPVGKRNVAAAKSKSSNGPSKGKRSRAADDDSDGEADETNSVSRKKKVAPSKVKKSPASPKRGTTSGKRKIDQISDDDDEEDRETEDRPQKRQRQSSEEPKGDMMQSSGEDFKEGYFLGDDLAFFVGGFDGFQRRALYDKIGEALTDVSHRVDILNESYGKAAPPEIITKDAAELVLSSERFSSVVRIYGMMLVTNLTQSRSPSEARKEVMDLFEKVASSGEASVEMGNAPDRPSPIEKESPMSLDAPSNVPESTEEKIEGEGEEETRMETEPESKTAPSAAVPVVEVKKPNKTFSVFEDGSGSDDESFEPSGEERSSSASVEDLRSSEGAISEKPGNGSAADDEERARPDADAEAPFPGNDSKEMETEEGEELKGETALEKESNLRSQDGKSQSLQPNEENESKKGTAQKDVDSKKDAEVSSTTKPSASTGIAKSPTLQRTLPRTSHSSMKKGASLGVGNAKDSSATITNKVATQHKKPLSFAPGVRETLASEVSNVPSSSSSSQKNDALDNRSSLTSSSGMAKTSFTIKIPHSSSKTPSVTDTEPESSSAVEDPKSSKPLAQQKDASSAIARPMQSQSSTSRIQNQVKQQQQQQQQQQQRPATSTNVTRETGSAGCSYCKTARGLVNKMPCTSISCRGYVCKTCHTQFPPERKNSPVLCYACYSRTGMSRSAIVGSHCK